MFSGVGVSRRILYSFVGYLNVSGSGSITSVGEERANLSSIVNTFNSVVSVGEVSSSSRCLGWATLLAHLSQRLMGELINRIPMLRRPSSSSLSSLLLLSTIFKRLLL